MEELDLAKTIDFEVVGDIKPIIVEILGYYDTYMSSDCDLHLRGTGISLPAYYPYLTYYGLFDKEDSINKKIISALYQKGLIKPHKITE